MRAEPMTFCNFVPQYGEIYEHNLWVSHHCSADCAAPPPHLPQQLAANVTSLRQSKEYSIIIKQGNEAA